MGIVPSAPDTRSGEEASGSETSSAFPLSSRLVTFLDLCACVGLTVLVKSALQGEFCPNHQAPWRRLDYWSAVRS